MNTIWLDDIKLGESDKAGLPTCPICESTGLKVLRYEFGDTPGLHYSLYCEMCLFYPISLYDTVSDAVDGWKCLDNPERRRQWKLLYNPDTGFKG